MMADDLLRSLNKSLPSDSDDGPDLVLRHSQLEQALSNIFGIPLSQSIASSIFGVVDTSGTITILRLSNSAAQQKGKAAGLEFSDGVNKARLLVTGNTVKCFKWNGSSWTEVFDYEGVEEPALVDKNDVGFTAAQALALVDDGYILGTTGPFSGKLKLVPDNIVNDGAYNFAELSDLDTTVFDGSWPTGYYVGINGDGEVSAFPPDDDTRRAVQLDVVNHNADLGVSKIGPLTLTGGVSSGIALRTRPGSFYEYNHGVFLPKGVYVIDAYSEVKSGGAFNTQQSLVADVTAVGKIFPKFKLDGPIPWCVEEVDSAFVPEASVLRIGPDVIKGSPRRWYYVSSGDTDDETGDILCFSSYVIAEAYVCDYRFSIVRIN